MDFEDFGKAKEEWLRGFLALPNGIPSQDTSGRIFAAIDNKLFAESFRNWTEGLRKKIGGEIVAIDGKTLRGSHHKSSARSAIHMVSARGRENSLVLGQIKVDEKSNEITAIPQHPGNTLLSGQHQRRCENLCPRRPRPLGRGELPALVLDVCFAEDACRIRVGHAAENMAILRHIALNVLRNDSIRKRGIKGKQKNASWDHSCFLSLLGF